MSRATSETNISIYAHIYFTIVAPSQIISLTCFKLKFLLLVFVLWSLMLDWLQSNIQYYDASPLVWGNSVCYTNKVEMGKVSDIQPLLSNW